MKTPRLILSMLVMILVQTSFAQRFYGQKIVGYVPSYGNASSVDYANLTHAMFAFIVPTPDGGITAQPSWELNAMNTFLNATQTAGTIRFICIGSTNFSTMANDPIAVDKFADTLKKFCLHYGFDGVDVDWEGLSTATERDNYDSVMVALEATIKPAGLLLTCTVGFGNYWGQWFPNTGLQKADWLQIMVYDQTGTWSASPFGNHSSYQHLLQAESYWVGRGFTRDKLVMGVPFYGYKFASTAGGSATAKRYRDIIAEFPNMADDINQTPGTDYTCFNGPALMRQKCQYLIDNNFGGIMIWEMTQDALGDRSQHEQIVCEYSNTNTCRISLTATKNHESLKAFNLYMSGEFMTVNAGKDGDAQFYFYDYSGRLIYETATIHLSEGMNSINIPASIQGLFICKVIVEGHYYSEKLYR